MKEEGRGTSNPETLGVEDDGENFYQPPGAKVADPRLRLAQHHKQQE